MKLLSKQEFDQLFFDNPLVYRYACSLFRPEKVLTAVICYLLLIMIAAINMHDSEAMYYFFMGLNFILLWVVAAWMAGTAIGNENISRNTDFFRMLPLTPLQKTVGILFGTNLITLIIGTVNLFIACLIGPVAVGFFDLINHLLILLAGSFFMINFNLATSLKYARYSDKKNVHLGTLTLIPAFFSASLSFSIDSNELISFYFINIHLLKIVACFAFFLGLVNCYCSLRLFADENAPVFSIRTVILWAAGLYALIFGIYLPLALSSQFHNWQTALMFILITISAWFFLCLSLKTREQYDQYCGSIRLETTAKPFMRFLRSSNISLFLMVFAMGAGPAFALSIHAGTSVKSTLELMLVPLLLGLYPALLAELWALLSEKYVKIIYAIIGAYVAYLVFPPMLQAGGDSSDGSYGLSIFSMLNYILGNEYRPGSENFLVFIIGHTILCGIAGSFVFLNYKSLIDQRKVAFNASKPLP